MTTESVIIIWLIIICYALYVAATAKKCNKDNEDD